MLPPGRPALRSPSAADVMSASNVKLVEPADDEPAAADDPLAPLPTVEARETDEPVAPPELVPVPVGVAADLVVLGTQTAPIPRTAERASITAETDFGPFIVWPVMEIVPT